MKPKKTTYTVCLGENDIQSLKELASKNDLPPSVMARVLLLRSMRAEALRLEAKVALSNAGGQEGI